MHTNNSNNFFNLSLTKYKNLFPELTAKQYRVVMAHSFGVSMSVLCISDESSIASCNRLKRRACENLGIKELDLRGVVTLRLLLSLNII